MEADMHGVQDFANVVDVGNGPSSIYQHLIAGLLNMFSIGILFEADPVDWGAMRENLERECSGVFDFLFCLPVRRQIGLAPEISEQLGSPGCRHLTPTDLIIVRQYIALVDFEHRARLGLLTQ